LKLLLLLLFIMPLLFDQHRPILYNAHTFWKSPLNYSYSYEFCLSLYGTVAST